MRKPKRKDLERLVAAMDVAPRPVTGPTRQRAEKSAQQGHKALIKAIEGVPGLSALREAAERVQTERADALQQYRNDSKAAAAEHAAAMLGRRGLIDDLAPEPDGIGTEVEPSLPVYFIRTSAGGRLGEQQIADGDTWAKWDCTVESGSIRTTTTESLSFFFLWHNARKRNVRVNITSGFSMRGHADTHAEGNGFPASLFFPDARVDVDVSARLTVWPLWLPNTPQPFQTMDITSCGVSAGTFSHSQAAAIAANPAMQTVSYFVPREAYLLIETGMVAEFSVLQGTGELDFASADAFRFDFPYCFVSQE